MPIYMVKIRHSFSSHIERKIIVMTGAGISTGMYVCVYVFVC